MKIIACLQGSQAWLNARAGIPTASEFGRLVAPKTWKIRTGDGPHTFLCEKLAEWWTGMPLPQVQGFGALEQGTILEEEALPWFSLETGLDVQRVGFVTTDSMEIGCSPDGLIGDTSGLEAKCPQSPTHTDWLLAGTVPDEHLPQIHGCMFVTGRAEWRFLSYRRGFPKLLLTVQRDEKVQATLKAALDAFLERLEEGKARLIEINGGHPPRATGQPASAPPDQVGPLDLPPVNIWAGVEKRTVSPATGWSLGVTEDFGHSV